MNIHKGNNNMKMRNIILVSISLFLGSCSLTPLQNKAKTPKTMASKNELKQHLIYIDKNGDLIDPYTKKVIKNEDDYVNEILKTFENSSTNKLTIFIHGGLNTYQNATKKANQILKYYDQDKDSYILVIGWQAGPFTNYLDHLFFVRGGERRKIVGPLTSPFILVEDVARSVANAPRATIDAGMTQFTLPIRRQTGEEKAYGDALDRFFAAKEFNVNASGHVRGLTYKDIVGYANPVKFGTAPFVDGFGRGTWNSLSRRTELLISKDSAFAKNENSKTALHKFLDQVDSSPSTPEITLIGHSMGTMVANNILIRKPTLNYKNIVYMAAAASLKDVESNVVPFLKQDKNLHFYGLSLNPYREIAESNVYDTVPRGSLLIWIDTYLTSVKSFTEKTSGNFFNMIRAAETIFPSSVRNQVHLTMFGFRSKTDKNEKYGPQIHGEFDEYKFWDANFWIADQECGLYFMDEEIKDTALKEKCRQKDVNEKNRKTF